MTAAVFKVAKRLDNDTDDPAKLARTDCASAEIRVVKVVNKVDDSVCAQDDLPLTYPEPPTTFCVAEP